MDKLRLFLLTREYMVPSFIVILLVNLGRLLARASKTFGRGSGTSVPGYFVERFWPAAVRYLGEGYEEVIMISGTNGKTTTRALINAVYEAQGVDFVSNVGGANIYRGVVTALLNNRTRTGKLRARTAVLEVEEATLPRLTKYFAPTTLILTNIFRDQLDAYGEINQTLDYFVTTLEQTSPRLILNQDDPKLVNYLAAYVHRAVGFGIEKSHRPIYEATEAIRVSPAEAYVVRDIVPGPQIKASLRTPEDTHAIISPLPGTFNLYNFAAAVAATYERFGAEVIETLEGFTNVFGRGEVIAIGDTSYHLYLVKNPAGFGEVLKYLISLGHEKLNLNLLINDNIADGRDVSWLWDVPFEEFFEKQELKSLRTAGGRGLDMLLRVEYAGGVVSLEDNYSIPELVTATKDNRSREYILCTYTALLEFRQELGKYTDVKDLGAAGN